MQRDGFSSLSSRRRLRRMLGASCKTWSVLARSAFARFSRENGKEFTDRLICLLKRAATSEHEFEKLSADLDIKHRLTPPESPQTNGTVERFISRFEEVLQSHQFRSGEELEATLNRYVWLQPITPRISLGQQVALTGDEGLAQHQA